MMGEVGITGAMHPGGLFYSTATIRQELERIAGGWPERAAEPPGRSMTGSVDPFRDYGTIYPDEAALLAARAAADAAADALFRGAGVVVVTLGLIETWRSPATGNTYRQIPHPAVFRDARRRVPPADGRRDARRPRADPTGSSATTSGADAGRHDLAGPAAHDVHAARRPGRQHRVEEPHPGRRLRVRRPPP